MDILAHFGRDLEAAALPTLQAFGNLLRRPERLALLNNTRKEEHRYSNQSRHVLDLYRCSGDLTRPRSEDETNGKPVIVFIHGGGNVSGGRIDPAIEGGVVYKGLGYFLSEQLGYDTVVMDYRLLQHGGHFNSGGEDLDLVVKWIENNLSDNVDTESGKVVVRDLVIMGNSAGGLHLAGWLFDDAFVNTRQRLMTPNATLRLKTAVILSSMTLLNPNIEAMRTVLLGYYGTEEEVVSNSPLNLMRRAVAAQSSSGNEAKENLWPSILLITTEFDPEFVVETGHQFVEEWARAGGQIEYWELKGHNHLSPPLALGTGQPDGEAWGFELGRRLAEMARFGPSKNLG